MSHPHGTLIVGASQAGLQIATSLRQLGYADRIMLAGAENVAPYQRPPLSKAWLQGALDDESLEFRAPSFYDDNRIELILGQRIVRIQRDAQGGVATSDSGRILRFDRLALATGARARRLDLPSAELLGVHVLRTIDDARALRASLAGAKRLVVIGAGFVGLEVAASARKHGVDVVVVMPGERILSRAVSRSTSAALRGQHELHGVRFISNARVERMTCAKDGRVGAVRLDDGTEIPADLVVVGIGATPRTELASSMGLATDDGVIVDERCVASDGVTVAAGDCARIVVSRSANGGPETFRFESVNTAIEQGKIAASSLMGDDRSYNSVPWFWSDQYDVKLQVAGSHQGHDSQVVRGDLSRGKGTVLLFRGGELTGVECLSNPAEFLAARAALHSRAEVDVALASDASVPLKRAFAQPEPARLSYSQATSERDAVA